VKESSLRRARLAAVGAAVAAAVFLAPASAWGASGGFGRAWGKDVASTGPGNTGNGFEICVAANGDACKTGVEGGGGGEMYRPDGVATDSAGNVYVADQFYNRIEKFNSAGSFERAWGKDVVSSGPGDTGTGFEICVAANGATCKAGMTGGLGGEMYEPDAVAADSAGNVYVSEYYGNRIQKFDSSGSFQRAWGKDVVTTGPGNAGTAFEICVAANGDICKAGVGGTSSGEVWGPTGLAVDSAGNVYVSDWGNTRIDKFDSSGSFERAWGRDVAGMGPGDTGTGFEICVAANFDACKSGAGGELGGEIYGPHGIATDPAGNVYVADLDENRIQKFDSSGNFRRAWGKNVVSAGPGNTGTGFEICVAANGDTCQSGSPGLLGGEMNGAYGVATDLAGNVYVADQLYPRIEKFDSSGGFQRAWGKDVVSAGPGNTGTGFEICVAANGDTCKQAAQGGLGGEMDGPTGLATGSAGDVYVADTDNHRIQKFADPPDSGPTDTGTGTGTSGTGITGQRATALKKCKKKRRAARRKCKRRAKALPV
jgi:tripartite motif-containing protein 71